MCRYVCVQVCVCVCMCAQVDKGVVSIPICLPWAWRTFAEVSQNGWDPGLLGSLPMIHGHSGEVYEALKLQWKLVFKKRAWLRSSFPFVHFSTSIQAPPGNFGSLAILRTSHFIISIYFCFFFFFALAVYELGICLQHFIHCLTLTYSVPTVWQTLADTTEMRPIAAPDGLLRWGDWWGPGSRDPLERLGGWGRLRVRVQGRFPEAGELSEWELTRCQESC